MSALRNRFSAAYLGAPPLALGVLFVLNLVDELDQTLFGAVTPNIRDTFELSEQTVTSLAAIAGALVIMLVVPIAVWADRHNRVRMTATAAMAWGSMTVMTGVAGFMGVFAVLIMARFGAGLGRVMNEPVHASLLADYYPPPQHGRVFSIHRMANPLGIMLVLPCAALADIVGWRLGFVFVAIPTILAVLLVSRLHEPVRGASVDIALATRADENAPKVPFGEAWRTLVGIPTLKRIWASGFLFGAAVIPITAFFAFFFENVYNVESITARGAILTLYGLGSVVGLQIGSRLATKALMAGKIDHLARLCGVTMVGLGGSLLLLALAPWIGLSIAAVFLVGVTGPVFASYNLPIAAAVAPPRLRSQAFGWFVFWFGFGAIALTPILSGLGENSGYRLGISVLAVMVAASGLIYFTAHQFIRKDAERAFAALMAEAKLRSEREAGDAATLVCRGVEVAYDQVQVLFGVDMEVREGECVALLGTNGAGKSTLLKAISGVVDVTGGAIFFDGRDITQSDGVATTKAGIIQVPGGKAVFPTLTVAEHLRAAGWLYRNDPAYLKQANAQVLETFPRLEERIDQQAGNLSGGEQQMLALGMAFIAKPKLLMIDELSLGLAPTIVEQLLDIVRQIQAGGTSIILVEQSINIALTVADRAYFLEKGEVRFEGSTAELLTRDDIVRSVFLEGARTGGDGNVVVKESASRSSNGNGNGSAPGDTVLAVSGLVKRFGGIRAVDDTSFELHQGEILGLIGPNGAGKTTIFDLVSGFLIPDQGRIRFAGHDITRMAPDGRAWLGLGRSFQDARLVPSLSVAENIAIGLERHLDLRDHVASTMGLPGVVQLEADVAWTVHDLIELMNLGAFRDKFVRELSTGSRRIVDLAMCIAHDPNVLLLDEPSSGIAQRETEALGPLLKRIQSETGCALLVIEHDMPLITSVSDRMIALELGSPISEGTPQEVISNPRVVSSYLGGDMAVINRSGTAPDAEPEPVGARPGNGSSRAPRRTEPLRVARKSGSRQ